MAQRRSSTNRPDATASTPDQVYETLAKRFENKVQFEKVIAVAPDSSKALPGTIELDSTDQKVTVLKSSVEKITLSESPLLQMAVRSDGSELYAIFSDQASVSVYDPKSMTLVGEIAVARYPVSIWADQSTLVVACRDSRTVTFVDISTRRVTRAVRVPPHPAGEIFPRQICGMAPDGSMIVVFDCELPFPPRNFVFLIDRSGGSIEIDKADVDHCVFGDNPNKLIRQQDLGSGTHSVFIRDLEDRSVFEVKTQRADLFGRKGFTGRDVTGSIFLAADGKRIIVPGAPSLAIHPNLNETLLEIPGSVIAENSNDNSYVTWRRIFTPYPDHKFVRFEILYVSSSTGRIHRRIEVIGEDIMIVNKRNRNPRGVFVPGHELVLVRSPDSNFGPGDGTISMVRCGPLLADAYVPADANIAVINEPPKTARIGQSLTYTPSFAKPTNAKSIVYKLKQGPEGMKLDPLTGKIDFTPKDINIGSHDVIVIATVDDAEVPVIQWILEVD